MALLSSVRKRNIWLLVQSWILCLHSFDRGVHEFGNQCIGDYVEAAWFCWGVLAVWPLADHALAQSPAQVLIRNKFTKARKNIFRKARSDLLLDLDWEWALSTFAVCAMRHHILLSLAEKRDHNFSLCLLEQKFWMQKLLKKVDFTCESPSQGS